MNNILTLTPRDYQIVAEENIRDSFRRRNRAVLLVAPTGSGKTVTFSRIAAQAAERGNNTLILVHRQELLRQTSRTLDGFGIQHGLIGAGMSVRREFAVQVASVQTLLRRLDTLEWVPKIIIVDEAHHATPKSSWGQVLAHFNTARVLGVTATPERLDGQGLGRSAGGFFDDLVVGPSVRELTERGYLSPAVVYAPPSGIDYSRVKMRCGDFAQNEIAAAVDKPTITGDAVATYRKHCDQQPAIVFCASVAHAEHVAVAFADAGYRAASIDGTLDATTRASRIADLASGALHVLTSCDIISEGTDIPVVSAAILLRPTASLALCLQQIGRALRPFPGKTHATILDHVGNVIRHGLPDDDRTWSLDSAPRKRKNNTESIKIRQCDQCFAVHRPAPVCPSCGYQYPVQSRQIAEVAGELVRVDGAVARQPTAAAVRTSERKQARSLEELIELGRRRGYSHPHAWATHVFASRARARA